jgi:hypothetical protein
MYDLDTPAVHSEAISALTRALGAGTHQEAAFVCGHHNLVPQDVLRISPYTEMVNSGAFRAAMMNAQRPIIYLHGHIHQDPITILRDGSDAQSMLILVSAPLLEDGFNVVVIEFDDDGIALGCNIEKYRLVSAGQCRHTSTVTIPFWRGRTSILGAMSALEVAIVGHISGRPRMYFRDLYDILLLDTASSEIDIARALRRLWWLGIIEIEYGELSPAKWAIRRLG